MIQAENDDGDITEMRDGIFDGLRLTAAERAEVCNGFHVICESSLTGTRFTNFVAACVDKYRPDLLIVDPTFAYLGNDVCDQAAVSKFLRNGFNPILQKYGCGLWLIHHTNKPATGKEKREWTAGDYAYLGSGTAEFANWARAVIGIRSLGSHDVFEVVLGKRGKRAGLVDSTGKPIYTLTVKHGVGSIFWSAATADDVAGLTKAPRAGTEDVFALIPENGSILQAALEHSASAKGVGRDTLRKSVKDLLSAGRIVRLGVPRQGAKAAVAYRRSDDTPAPQFDTETTGQ